MFVNNMQLIMKGTDVQFSLISHGLKIIDNLLRQVARHSSKLASSGNANVHSLHAPML
jgi:hypothetical protein